MVFRFLTEGNTICLRFFPEFGVSLFPEENDILGLCFLFSDVVSLSFLIDLFFPFTSTSDLLEFFFRFSSESELGGGDLNTSLKCERGTGEFDGEGVSRKRLRLFGESCDDEVESLTIFHLSLCGGLVCTRSERGGWDLTLLNRRFGVGERLRE